MGNQLWPLKDRGRFPVQLDYYCGRNDTIPLAYAEAAYELYADLYPGQSFETMGQRGGFGVTELLQLALEWMKRRGRLQLPPKCAALVGQATSDVVAPKGSTD